MAPHRRANLRSWLALDESEGTTSPRKRPLTTRIYCNRARAAGLLGGGVLCSAALYSAIRHATTNSSRLADLLPTDLDALSNPTIIGALGVQLLLFGGFAPTATGWRRKQRPPASLLERVDLIAPTWKPGGKIDYSWPGTGGPAESSTWSLFEAATKPPLANAGATVGSLARALEGLGLRADDFDSEARIALHEMLTWRLPVESEQLALSTTRNLTLLILSFDATPDCRSVDDCQRPGPSNELLAATADAFVSRRWREHGQHVDVIAQWEVAAALRTLKQQRLHHSHGNDKHGRLVVTPVGTPGIFENTAQIYEHMLARMDTSACDEHGGGGDGRVVLLAHPDHLRRALRIGESAFKGFGGPCQGLRLVPAMQPYTIAWPDTAAAASAGTRLNLYAGVSSAVHTGGEVKEATWYDASSGYFPDGEPQRWARRREVWIAYEAWARAKGVATGVIRR